MARAPAPILTAIVAIPETAGSALYGMVDVLRAAGSIWQTLVREPAHSLFDVKIVSPARRPFRCGHEIPVVPHASVADDPDADIVILPEIWLGPDESFAGRHAALIGWVRKRYQQGATLYSACSGAVMLAETGLLDGRDATSHWGYANLFRTQYPRVRFRPEPNLCFADARGRIVTAGGTTSWHDLALHIIARHASPGEALRIAKVYLLKWHGEGQLPYTPLVRRMPTADAAVQRCLRHLETHFLDDDAVAGAVQASRLPERTIKRRFKQATGITLIEHLQNVRIEKAKALLEQGRVAVDEVSASVGYEDASFFRRLFKRSTGLAPSEYRRMFEPLRSP
ncbi:MAG: helix-turn-helix domain-containing protein [Burkholderiales bacterium]